MKLTEKDLPGLAALVDVVSRFGIVAGVDDDLAQVTIALAGTAYEFAVRDGNVLGASERWVMLVSMAGVEPGWVTPTRVVFVEETAGSFEVPPGVAERITERFDAYGRCGRCEQDRHTSCVRQGGDGTCRCRCSVEWAVARARMALEPTGAPVFVPELAAPWPPVELVPAPQPAPVAPELVAVGPVMHGAAVPLPRRTPWLLPRRR